MNLSYYICSSLNRISKAIDVLKDKQYVELEASGNQAILIDNVNKTFWKCSMDHLKVNQKIIENRNKSSISEITSSDLFD